MGNHRRKRRRLKPQPHHHTEPGTRPGTLTIPANAHATVVRVMAYSHGQMIEREVSNPQELQELVNNWPVVWVDVIGLGSESTLRGIAQIFQIHPLALEDIVHVHQRTKVDPFDQNLFCVLRIPDHSNEQLTEQFSLVLGKNYLVTFQERPGDCFDMIRAGIRTDHSSMRQGVRPDFLAYRLIDASIDAYFPVVEKVGDRLDDLDDLSVGTNGQSAFRSLQAVKRELLMLRRAVWPLRDALNELRRESTPFVTNETRVYLRDCYDHTVQLIDLLESYRDISGDVRDYYLSSISNRMNEVIRTLTVISTIFLPITFIAGVYGMNFDYMPELHWVYGYEFALVMMVVVALGLLWFFKRRGWLQRDPTHIADASDHDTPQ
jgi:magnesium transporter